MRAAAKLTQDPCSLKHHVSTNALRLISLWSAYGRLAFEMLSHYYSLCRTVKAGLQVYVLAGPPLLAAGGRQAGRSSRAVCPNSERISRNEGCTLQYGSGSLHASTEEDETWRPLLRAA
jgi:hypothetical protein